MLPVVSALLPVFMVIVLGYFLRHRAVLEASAWHGLENLCYFVLFPVLLVKTLAVTAIGSAEIVRFSGALLFAIFTMSALLLLAYPVLGMPALMFTGCLLFGVEGLPRTVAMLAAAVPTAAASFVLARQMGGDAPLMANLITLQVLGAVVTLPLVIWVSQVV